MATHFSTLAWKFPWTEEPCRLQSMGLQRVGHDWATSLWRWQKKNALWWLVGGYVVVISQRISSIESQSVAEFLVKLCLRLLSLFCCCCSLTHLCPTLCDPINCSTPGFPVLHYLPEFAQTHVHWVDDATISSSVVPFSSYPQSFSASGSLPLNQLFTSGH